MVLLISRMKLPKTVQVAKFNKGIERIVFMKYSTFVQSSNNPLKEPMFFGQPVNIARYDQQKFEIFEKFSKID